MWGIPPFAGEGGPQGRERERRQEIAASISYSFGETPSKSRFVIPAQAGIQENQGTEFW
jgi:hypothetical protein